MSEASPHSILLMSRAVPTMGMERVALRLANALDDSFEIVCLQGDAPPDLSLRFRAFVRGAGVLSRLRAYIALSRLAFELRGSTTTVVAVGVWVAVPWLVLCRVFRSRAHTVVWEHSLCTEKIEQSVSLRVLNECAKLTYCRADKVVAVSKPLADDLKRFPRNVEIQVIPNPIGEELPATELLSVQPHTPPCRLISVGALSAVKRQSVIIRALAQCPDVTLDIVGDGPDRNSLLTLAEEVGVTDRVTFHGHLETSDVERMLRSADLLVHAAAGETFGMVFFEAARLGLYVLAADNRVSREMIPKYVPGAVFDGTTEELVYILGTLQLAGHETKAVVTERLHARQRRVAELSTSRVVARWREVLGSLEP